MIRGTQRSKWFGESNGIEKRILLNISQVQHNPEDIHCISFTKWSGEALTANIHEANKFIEIIYQTIKQFKNTERNKHMKHSLESTFVKVNQFRNKLHHNSQCTIDRIINNKINKK